MAQFLAQRWKRQPQGPVAVDWGNPLTRGLVSIILPPSLSPKITRVGTSSFAAAMLGRFGGGTVHVGGQSSMLTELLPAFDTAATIFYVMSLPIEASSVTSTFGIGTSGTGSQLFAIQGQSASVTTPRAVIRTIDGGGISSAETDSGSYPYSAWCASFNGSPSSLTLYRDGKNCTISQLNQASGSSLVNLDNFSVGGANRGSDGFCQTGADTALGAAWSRALSDPEIAALSENPWQLFRAPRPIIYSLPAATTPVGGVFLRQRWKRQPQGPVAVDWGNPLARGLVCAVSDSFEAVNRNRLTLDSRISRRPSPEGIGWYRETELSSGPNLSTSTGTKIPSGSQFTIAAVVRADPASTGDNRAVAYWGHDPRFWWNQSTSQFVFMQRDSAGTGVYAVDYAATAAVMRAGTTVAGVWDGANIRLYRGGVQQASTALTSISTSVNEDVLIGSNNAYFTYHWIGWIPALNAWARPLSDSELRAWHENPWQLFRAPKPIVFSLPGGATIPTLSSPTVINITTTGATPRVTLTF